MTKNKTTYAHSGVDIKKADALVERIKGYAQKTARPELLGGIGGFSALAELPAGYAQPVLVTATDGVGTKLRLAIENNVSTIGQDLVAMCVNDLIVCGAEPFLFLDYYATGSLDADQAAQVIASIAEACYFSDCSLVGGETAEMPGMYKKGDYDLAGFCVGVVEKSRTLDSNKLRADMALVALGSSGCHSNGYSLVRTLLYQQLQPDMLEIDGRQLIDWLLEPTLIYAPAVRALLGETPLIHALCHITGGGITDNLARIVPPTLQAEIWTDSWQVNALFRWLQQESRLDDYEMRSVFNMGVGMIAAVSTTDCTQVIETFATHKIQAWQIGILKPRLATDTPVSYV